MPAYCRTRGGRLYRVLRSSMLVADERLRLVLRAVPVKQDGDPGREVARELDARQMLDQIAKGQVIATPEQTFESLWEQLRLDLDVDLQATPG